ncbi:hypothetical protein EMPS_08098 [Entomortierella parvispora]|uniref:GDP-fucose protein O-fucosyltransferase 2 n=1 Tax=Entomortierella parvispora TaxID=205924 RepID=A0A9P3HFS1_9FUNG|nr:hypothetical protein EMPS_08098 [Entomortierella parvispora]
MPCGFAPHCSNSALLGTPTPATAFSARSPAQRSCNFPGYNRIKGGSIWFSRVAVYGMLAFIAFLFADVERLIMYHYDHLLPISSSTVPASSLPQLSLYTTTSTYRSIACKGGHHRSSHEQECNQEQGYNGDDERQRRKTPAYLMRRRNGLMRVQELEREGQSERSRLQRRGMGFMPIIFCHATPSPDKVDNPAKELNDKDNKPAPEQEINFPRLKRMEKVKRGNIPQPQLMRRALPGFRTGSQHDLSENDKEEDEQGFVYLGESENTQGPKGDDEFVKRQYSQAIYSFGDFYLYDQKSRHVLGFNEEKTPSTEQAVLSSGDVVDSGEPQEPQYPLSTPAAFSQKRFLMVDMKLEEGISEVRTALEHAVFAARLTERTLVLPPFLYFRGCVNKVLCRGSPFQEVALRPFTHFPVRGDEIVNSTRKLQPRYAVPFERIYDIPRLREYIDVVSMEDWVQHMIQQQEEGAGRPGVDFTTISGLQWLEEKGQFHFSSAYHQELLDQFFDPSVQPSLTLKVNIHRYLYRDEPFVVNANPQLFHTRPGALYGHDKSPSRSLNGTRSWKVSELPFTGFKESFGPQNETVASKQVLLFQGGITAFEQQMMVFESESARADFEQVSMHWVRYSAEVRRVAEQLVRNLVLKTGGRNYLAVHYRRGEEFLRAEIPKSSHTNMGWYRKGLGTRDLSGPMLRVTSFLMNDRTIAKFDIQDFMQDSTDIDETKGRAQEQTKAILELQAKISSPSYEGTRERNFYLATDERDEVTLQQLRDQGAIVLADLMDDPYFLKDNLDWMGFPDWFAYLDQLICVKARQFWGSPMSVFSGSIINQRIGHERSKRRRRQMAQRDGQKPSKEDLRQELERQRSDGSGNGWLYRPPPMQSRYEVV